MDKFVPVKIVKSGRRLKPPWTNFRSVKRAKKKKRSAATKANKSGLNANHELFIDSKKKVEDTIYKAKADYESSRVQQIKTEPKKFYNYARHFTRSSATVEVLEHQGSRITDDTEKAEILNDFFASVLTTEQDTQNINTPLPDRIHQTDIYDILVTPKVVREKLVKLHLNKACGPDAIHVNVLKNVPDFDEPFSILFNHSLKSGLVPQDWKDANIQDIRPDSITWRKQC